MNIKELSKKDIRENLGWAYSDLKWLTDAEAVEVTSKRQELLSELSSDIQYCFNKSKLYSGQLSPGCVTCGEGHWSCLFINHPCTANCFFCPQDRKSSKDPPPHVIENLEFSSPDDYVNFLDKFEYKGVGISGGESLLAFDLLIAYIQKIKNKFGKDIYTWIYTNGDLVDMNRLTMLKESGLDEIRYNIYPGNYSLDKVKEAIGTIDTVSVEIPAIPEDYEILTQVLSEMSEIGIKHLNLHELITTPFNYKNLVKRGYTFQHYSALPVLESEITALQVIKFASENEISLPINYCNSIYKQRFQGRGIRSHFNPWVSQSYEELTESGFIRTLSINEPMQKLSQIAQDLEGKGDLSGYWKMDKDQEALYIHPLILNQINFNGCFLYITYFSPQLDSTKKTNDSSTEVKLSDACTFFINRKMEAKQQLKSPISIHCFNQLYIEGRDTAEVLKFFHQNYELTSKKQIEEMRQEKEVLLYLHHLERVGEGFHEIY